MDTKSLQALFPGGPEQLLRKHLEREYPERKIKTMRTSGWRDKAGGGRVVDIRVTYTNHPPKNHTVSSAGVVDDEPNFY